MRVIITGSTGMIGKGVLLECLDQTDIAEVLIVNRRSLELEHPKLKEALIPDFFEIELVAPKLASFDVCMFCLGTSAVGKSEEAYTKITYDLTLLFAKTFLDQNPKASFLYVSGAGTDGTEKGRQMWARVKGRTENDLINMSFEKVHAFRPGYIQPLRGIKSATGWYNGMYNIIGFLYPLLKKMPKYVTDTTSMAKAMIKVAKDGFPKPVLESVDINKMGGEGN